MNYINIHTHNRTKSDVFEILNSNNIDKNGYSSIGIHPWDINNNEINYRNIDEVVKNTNVLAIGEIGLDYYYLQKSHRAAQIKKKQKEVFRSQLILARRFDLPVIIHCRQAHDDMIEILSDFRKSNRNLIPSNRPWDALHCFSGDEDLAWKYFNLGLMISFTGLIPLVASGMI